MKIIGKANLVNYAGKVSSEGIIVDCTEEESKESGDRYVRDKNNLFDGKYFSLLFHNDSTMSGYSPFYSIKLCKQLGFLYTRHVSGKYDYIINFKRIIPFSRIKFM